MMELDWVDTALNVLTFAFIGVLVWLYFLEVGPEKERDGEEEG